MSIPVLNTDAGLTGKTLVDAEDAQTITGSKLFDLDPNPPFTVSSGSAKVDNLDADKVDGIEGTNLAEINNTETITSVWTFSAKPSINAGLQFPAVQASSADANTLDDYEEGSWTPTLVGTTGAGTGSTYTVQVGRYVKWGKMVHCDGRITITNLGTLPTQAAIGALPFTAENVTNLNPALRFGYFANTAGASGIYFLAGFVLPNSTTAAIFLNNAAGAGTMAGAVAADFTNTLDIVFSVDYRATA